LLCPIDDEGREEAGGQANYDESEDEEDIDLKPQGTPPSSSAVLPVDEDDEIDLCSDELAEILADGPITRATKTKVTENAAFAKVDSEDGGDFELNDWVYKKTRDLTCDLAVFVIYTVIYLIYPPQKSAL